MKRAPSAPSRHDIIHSIENEDWATLRKLTLQPGGLVSARIEAWEFLLGVDNSNTWLSGRPSESLDAHPDEPQVKLDTDRSFVSYPDTPVSSSEKKRLKDHLYSIIVLTLRRHRKLSYFQGYHDIVSVFLLTFMVDSRPENDANDLRRIPPCIEKLSLHRLRDAMGEGLGPLLGGLRILRRLIRLADPSFSELLEKTSPLPYFALSNILTLLSHDVPSLSLIQHVFDYLLARPPVAILYLEAAIILSRRDDAMSLAEEHSDDGMMHTVLTQLPPLSDDYGLGDPHDSTSSNDSDSTQDPKRSNETELVAQSNSVGIERSRGASIPSPPSADQSSDSMSSACIAMKDAQRVCMTVQQSSTPIEDVDAEDRTVTDDQVAPSSLSDQETMVCDDPPSHPSAAILVSFESDPESWPAKDRSSPRPAAEGTRGSNPHLIPLTQILSTADMLFEQYPPLPTERPSASATSSLPDTDTPSNSAPSSPSSTPVSLRIDEILGPSSVCLTWSTGLSNGLTDEEAENLMEQPLETVVLPNDGSSDRDFTENESEKSVDTPSEELRRRKQRQIITPSFGVGAAVVIGIAAVMLYSVDRGFYSSRSQSGGSRSLKEWTDIAQWVGVLVLDAGGRIVGGP